MCLECICVCVCVHVEMGGKGKAFQIAAGYRATGWNTEKLLSASCDVCVCVCIFNFDAFPMRNVHTEMPCIIWCYAIGLRSPSHFAQKAPVRKWNICHWLLINGLWLYVWRVDDVCFSIIDLLSGGAAAPHTAAQSLDCQPIFQVSILNDVSIVQMTEHCAHRMYRPKMYE